MVPGFVTSIGIGFLVMGDARYPLPVFGAVTSAIVWATTIFAVIKLPHRTPVTTVHLFVTGSLVVLGPGMVTGVLAGERPVNR